MMLARTLAHSTDNTLIQLFRYTFVGGAAWLVDMGSLCAFTELAHVHYLYSAALAFVMGLAVNYALSVVWVFNRRTINNRSSEFLIFAAIGIFGLAFNEAFIWFFTEEMAMHYMLSKVVSTAFVYLWNFFARKFILYR